MQRNNLTDSSFIVKKEQTTKKEATKVVNKKLYQGINIQKTYNINNLLDSHWKLNLLIPIWQENVKILKHYEVLQYSVEYQ